MIQGIISRFLAIILFSISLTSMLMEELNEELALVENMTHSELIDYFIQSNSINTYEAFAMFLIFGACFVASVESVAFLFRWIWNKVFIYN